MEKLVFLGNVSNELRKIFWKLKKILNCRTSEFLKQKECFSVFVFLFKIFLKLFVQRKNCIIFILKNSDQDLLHKDDHEMLCKVFTYEHYSKDPLLLVKKIEYDVRMGMDLICTIRTFFYYF